MCVVTAQRLTPETRTALALAMAEIERLQAGTSDLGVRGLLERAEADLRQGWPEAAHDALERARALLAACIERDAR